MTDDYVLSIHQASLFEAEDLHWPLSYGSSSGCSASRQNFHFVAQLSGNKSNHLFHGSWASSMFSRQGRDLTQDCISMSSLHTIPAALQKVALVAGKIFVLLTAAVTLLSIGDTAAFKVEE
ncbi:unnamed protein product [Sphagnum jensenii]|uniref:Uncharacterized protein n=1 Tax=Sphagnum jensenii TaxID=128206 RepID=A0ABP0VVS6_9BRYO